jgi:hypothetical protein
MSDSKQSGTENQSHRFTVTFFPDKFASSQRREALTLSELALRIEKENKPSKAQLPWLVLASFGENVSAKQCYRTRSNLTELSGIEVEHDAGTLSFDEVIERLAAVPLQCLVYTSPSYQRSIKERWRILAPFWEHVALEDRTLMVARLNGVLSGALAGESFDIARGYLYGKVGGNRDHRVVVLDGDFIDLCDDLDQGAMGKPRPLRKDHVNLPAKSGEVWARDEAEIAALLIQSGRLNASGERQWHNSMLSATASMVGKGWTDEQIYEACKPYCPEGLGDIERMIESAREKWRVANPGFNWGKLLAVPLKALAKAQGVPPPIKTPNWRERYANMMPKGSFHNTELAIDALGIRCSNDTFHRRLWMGRNDVGSPIEPLLDFMGEVTDSRIALLRGYLSDTFGVDFTEKHVRDAVIIKCLKNSFDPVADMLAEAEKNWDGKARLDRMAVDYFNAEDTPLNRAMVRKTMIAAVARVRRPGCKFDTILTMESPEGWNKSSAWAVLSGEENFSDANILPLSEREIQEQLASVWIHENAELAGMKKADTDRVKTFASRQVDRARPAYGHVLIEQPRHSIEVGTTNSDKYLQSMTGNRRFWPIIVQAPIDLGKLRAARLQLWGEASYFQTSGESLTLDESLWQEAALEQENRRLPHPWETRIDGMQVIPRSGALSGSAGYGMMVIHDTGYDHRVHTRDIFEHVLELRGYQMHAGHAQALQGIMQMKGWKHKANILIEGKQGAGYVRVPVKKVS